MQRKTYKVTVGTLVVEDAIMSAREPPTTYKKFNSHFQWQDPPPIYVCRVYFPIGGMEHIWCHVSFPLIMGVLMISEEKEGSWKEICKAYISQKRWKKIEVFKIESI